ncbi:MAG TPA: peptide ABC transporter substrate-binding protein [Holophaga sp.]|nr:peptide ABC transporter substrate-binding protein [Holophaga sp.]
MKLFCLVLAAVMAAAELPGQDLRYNNGAEPESLDPLRITGIVELDIHRALFEGLTMNDPSTAKGVPGLAEGWTVSPDGRTFTFRLRRAVWSDETPITAQTVVDSWFRTLDPRMASESTWIMLDSLEGAKAYHDGKGRQEDVRIRALDAHTFQATFVSPTPYAPDMLTHWIWAVVPIHAIQKHGDAWTRPGNFVGNGPFVLKEWKPQERLVVVKNERYWDAAHVRLRSITFLPLEDMGAGFDKFKAGEIDWQPSVDATRLDEVRACKDYHRFPAKNVHYYVLNVTRKPFDDVRVRKALSMALDRTALVQQVLKGDQYPATGFVPAFGSYRTAKGNGFDPARARQLLAEAGHAGGKDFPRFQIIYNTNPNHQRVAEWVRQQWKVVLGIEADPVALDWEALCMARQRTHDFAVARAGWNADFPDPVNFLGRLLRTGSSENDGLYSNPKADALLDRADRMRPGPARDQVLMQAEAIMIDQDQALLPLFCYANRELIDLDTWGGWHENTMGIHPWKAIYKKK